jgi:hypothetical protein
MREELDKQLVEKYPKIFRDRYAPMTETAMCWGFDVGDGWYDILDNLCNQIQHYIDWKNKNEEKVKQVVAVQVKEKFGGLRFYYDGGDERIHGMVIMAEAWADTACEKCGAPGKRRSGGWIRTLCDEHANGRGRLEDND